MSMELNPWLSRALSSVDKVIDVGANDMAISRLDALQPSPECVERDKLCL
jgi:hypothetical protein